MRSYSILIFKLFCIGLLFVLFSCDPVPTEADAIKINESGVEYMNEGKYALAVQSFTEAVKNNRLTQPTRGTIYRNLAISYSSLANRDSALHFSTLAAKCYKKNSYDYLVNMAEVDLLTGRIDKALTGLLRAAKLEPDDMAANNTLGLIYLGEYDDKYTDLETALKYNKKAFEYKRDPVTEELLGRNYYFLEDYENAEIHFNHLLNNNPDVINYLLYAGMIKYRQKKIPEADLLFKKIIIQDSSYTGTIDDFRKNNQD